MSTSTDIDRIESGDILIEVDSSGDLVIHNLLENESLAVTSIGLEAPTIRAGNDISMQGTGTITNVRPSTTGIGWSLDSTVTGEKWGKIQFNDASGADVYWTSNREDGDAFRVRNVNTSNNLFNVNDSGLVDVQNGDLHVNGGEIQTPRGAPTTSELADGERMRYVSDGSDGNAAGDVVSARNNAGTIVSQVVIAAADDV